MLGCREFYRIGNYHGQLASGKINWNLTPSSVHFVILRIIQVCRLYCLEMQFRAPLTRYNELWFHRSVASGAAPLSSELDSADRCFDSATESFTCRAFHLSCVTALLFLRLCNCILLLRLSGSVRHQLYG